MLDVKLTNYFRQMESGAASASERDRLIAKGMKSVRILAKRYNQRYGAPVDDLVSEGTIGAIKAVDKALAQGLTDQKIIIKKIYNLALKHIQFYIASNWQQVTIGNRDKTFFFAAMKRSKEQTLEAILDDMSDAYKRRFSVKNAADIYHRYIRAKPLALNSKNYDGQEITENIPDPNPPRWKMIEEQQIFNKRMERLSEVLNELEPFELKAFYARYLADEPYSIEQIGDELDLSKSRVLNILASAEQKVQLGMLGANPAFRVRLDKRWVCKPQSQPV